MSSTMDLDPINQGLWEAYLIAEKSRIRDEMMPALDQFIDRLLERSKETWHRWAKHVASEVCDAGSTTPVRFPLFRRVLLPALAEGVQRREPGCARWLASFESLLWHCRKDTGLPEDLKTIHGLLSEAIRVDPADDRSRRRLVQRQASYLEYTLHELPAGVLYGTDGASADECEELLSVLGEFSQHLSMLPPDSQFNELIHECEFHYRTYAKYLRGVRLPGRYEEYLDRQRQDEDLS